VEEPLGEGGRLEDGFKQKEAFARVLVTRKGEQRVAELGVAVEAFGAAGKPEVELILEGARVGEKLRVITVRVVDEITGMDLEELRQQEARGVGEVWASAGLDLREIGLREAVAGLLDGAEQLLLGHGAIEAAE
jgi:hypothetical protein